MGPVNSLQVAIAGKGKTTAQVETIKLMLLKRVKMTKLRRRPTFRLSSRLRPRRGHSDRIANYCYLSGGQKS